MGVGMASCRENKKKIARGNGGWPNVGVWSGVCVVGEE